MRKVAVVFSAILALNPGCAATPVLHEKPPPGLGASRDEADMIAQEAVNARVTMLLHLDRLRGFRFSQRLMLLGGWADALEGTEIDPIEDIHRAFIAAHASHAGQVAVVLEHTAQEDRVIRSILAMHQKWHQVRRRERAEALRVRLRDLEDHIHELDAISGSRVEDRYPDPSRLPFPAAYRVVKSEFAHTEGPVLIAAPHPGIIAVLPPERVFAAFRLMEVGGLPRPRGGEAMVLRAWDPESSIQNGPTWSSDVRYADAVFSFDAEGNSTLAFRAVCSSPAAAREQAVRMTTQVEEAQTLSLGGARLRLFDFIQFHAENDRVKMRAHLYADDVDWIVAMTMKPM